VDFIALHLTYIENDKYQHTKDSDSMKDLKDLDSFALSSPTLHSTLIPRAQKTVMACFKELKHSPKEVLSVNENWATLFLKEQGLSVTLLNDVDKTKKYDTILGLDETLCRYSSESLQKNGIVSLLNYLDKDGLMLVSLRDYRNGNFHRRPLGDTVLNVIDSEDVVTVEVNIHHPQDKQAWNQKMYYIKNGTEFQTLNCGDRRTLYFKQLAKYCSDYGVSKFGFFKDIHWLGTWRRTPEHIAWIKG
jgi:hypothetical protein